MAVVRLSRLIKGALGFLWARHEISGDDLLTDSNMLCLNDSITNQLTVVVNTRSEERINHHVANINHDESDSDSAVDRFVGLNEEGVKCNQTQSGSLLNDSALALPGFAPDEHSSIEMNNSNSQVASDHQAAASVHHSDGQTDQTDDLGPSPAKKARITEIDSNQAENALHRPRPNPVTDIIALNCTSPSGWLIKGRVTAKSFLKRFSDSSSDSSSDGSYFSFEFMDRSAEIHIRMASDSPSDHLAKLYDLLEVNKCYLIIRGQVKRSNRRHARRTSYPYEIALDNHSIFLRLCDGAADIPPIRFSFANFEIIKNYPSGCVVDVIGICKWVEEASVYFRKKTNGQALRRNVFLIDQTKNLLLLKLWDEHASSFRGQVGDVIVLRHVLTSDFYSLSLTTSGYTSLEINRELVEADRLRQWWQTENNGQMQLTDKPTVASWSSLSEISFVNVKRIGCASIQTKATIVQIGQSAIYKGCTFCSRKLETFDSYVLLFSQTICSKCNRETDWLNWKLIASICISDHTGSVWVRVSHEQYKKLHRAAKLAKSIGELAALSEVNYSDFRDCLDGILFKTFSFRLKAKLDVFGEVVETTVDQVDKLNHSEYGYHLLEQLSE